MTIEERHDEEEEAAGPSKSRKQSLVEALSAESSASERQTNRVRSTPRTVPAVVLGTPPPLFPDSMIHSSPTLNRPNRATDPEEEEHSFIPLRRKSSARELADFFNNTPAPPSTTTSPMVNKNKGLKSFISKVTGKKKEDERTPIPSLTSSSTTRINLPLGEANPPRRQKSLTNVGSQSTPPSSYRHEEAPPIPSRSMLRKPSRTALEDTIDASAPSPSGERVKDKSATNVVVGTPEVATIQPTPSLLSPSAPSEGLAFLALNGGSTGAVRTRQQPLLAPALSQEKRSPGALEPLKERLSRCPRTPPPPEMQSSSRSLHAPSVSDVNSFRTAGERDQSVEEQKRASIQDTGITAAQSTIVTTPLESAETPSPKSGQLSIPLDDMVPLRKLLQHATSATECRLLLSAILTQMGVPQSPTDTSTTEPTPESRITAWLLAGREGPVVQMTPSSSMFSKLDEEVVTPIQNHSAQLPDVPEMPMIKGNDEEMLSSETTSVASVDDVEIHEGRSMSLAKSSQRSLPILS